MDDARRRALVGHYLGTFSAKLELLAGLAARLKSGHDDATLDELRRTGHKLAGSGGAYGFAQITEAGRAVEKSNDALICQRLDELIAVLTEIQLAHADG